MDLITRKCFLFLWVLFLVELKENAAAKRPNIIFILADDLGWNDVGFNNPYLITPNIDKLAREGVILDQAYVQPVCSPTRAALLTGRYPHRVGIQHYVILPFQTTCLPDVPVLPKKLKNLGYATHMIGKWHLGFCNWDCTPLGKGFDTFYGYLNGHSDYMDHTVSGYLDFWDQKKVVRDENGTYSTYLYADRAEKIISEHDKDKPLFLYLPFQSVHEPMEVPKIYENLYHGVKSKGRRTFLGMVTAMDDAIGRVVASLKKNDMYDDSIIVFSADNGGWPLYYGNNYPLRGSKTTVWEGGTRAAAFIHGKMLKKTGYRYDGMLHVVDWFPTLMSLAKGDKDSVPSDIDGVDQWKALQHGRKSRRNEFVYQLDDCNAQITGEAAIRMGDYKLIQGLTGAMNTWYVPQEISGEVENKTLMNFSVPLAPACTEDTRTPCKDKKWQLYNVKEDPTERKDLADAMPSLVNKMAARLDKYRTKAVLPNFPGFSPGSNPQLWGGVWSPGWC